MRERYKNNHTSEHSIFLREYFDIDYHGVDYYTPNNIAVEFKETFSKNPNANVKISKNQLKNSDLIVFCVFTSQFFVHKAKNIKLKYSSNNKLNLYVIAHNSLKKNYLFKTDNYISLKNFLDIFKLN